MRLGKGRASPIRVLRIEGSSTFPSGCRMALDSRLRGSDESQAAKLPELQRYQVTNQGLFAVTLIAANGLLGVDAILRFGQNGKSRKAGRIGLEKALVGQWQR